MTDQKAKIYETCLSRLRGLLDGENDDIVIMASIASVLHQAFADFYWTGFYRMMDGGLVVGPYQGTSACLKIAVGKGVCGTAAETGETQVVADVHAFPGHIACDAASASEIVVPVIRAGRVIAVLDVDSTSMGNFDAVDAEFLEKIVISYFS